MNREWWAQSKWPPYGTAVLAGLMLTVAYPRPSVASLAWVAPGLLLMSALAQGGRLAFRLGYLAGLVHYLSSLYWLLYNPCRSAALVGWLCLSSYLALYPAAWAWLGLKCRPVLAGKACTKEELMALCSASWGQRQRWALGCALAWVALEMIRGRFLTGFPWNLLGGSQYKMLPLIQISAVTGVYGLSFLMVWFSVGLAIAAITLLHRPTERWGWLQELILPLGALLGVLVFGFQQLGRPVESGRMLKAALVQPSVPQTLIWDPAENTNRFQKLLRLSQLALAAKPDLLIWPEGGVPDDPDLTQPAVTNLARTAKVWLILCADDAAPHIPPRKTNDYDYFNVSFLVSPAGQVRAAYHKQKLVVFGEYVPLVRWLPFLKWFTPVETGFTPGTRAVPFPLPDLGVRTSVLICFEDLFPGLARQAVEPDTDFLVNLTNDAWFDESAAQWQHAANAVFRAVENGLPLIRCTNNGLTCWIDPQGRMEEVYYGNSRDIYGAGFKLATIPLAHPGSPHPPTLYHLYGDWFGWSCVALTLLLWAHHLRPFRRGSPHR